MFLKFILYYIHWLVIFIFSTSLSVFVVLDNLTSSIIRDDIKEYYDYIVVGGGSSGAVTALRLSEMRNVTVLLIEAGIDAPDILDIPVLGPLKQITDVDWQYKTVPQLHSCFGLNNNSSLWPAGKILGGSTHLNYMVYLRGHENDFLSWKDSDSEEWSIHDINSYFDKAQEYLSNECGAKYFCNKKGSVRVREASFTTAFSDAILAASSEMGYEVTDLNSGGKTGFMRPQVNVNRDGTRWTSDQKLSGVENLKVLTGAVVTRVLLRDNFEAYAVEYIKGSAFRIVSAREEIVLSAGTVGTPKILMLSGIGPREVLSKAKVATKIELPVGKGLQDHITTGLDLVLLNRTIFSVSDLTSPMSAYEYFIHGRGPFTSGMVEAVGVSYADDGGADKNTPPDLEFMAMMAGASFDGGVFSKMSLGITDKVWNEYFAFLTNETATTTILPVLLHPKSRGEVELSPTDPFGPPVINPRYLMDPEDVRILTRGIRIIQGLMETRAMTEFGARFNRLTFPGCESLEFDSDEYWECYLRHLTLTSYHPVGTCRMGQVDDAESVVDHRLRVHGTNKLRVMDASVMPSLPSANTNAAVIMIAEKGSDLIKEDYHRRRSRSSLREILTWNGKCELP